MAIVRAKALRSATWWVGVVLFICAAITLYIGRGYGRAGIMPNFASLTIMLLSGAHTIYGLLFGVVVNDEDWHPEEDRKAYSRRRIAYVMMALAVGLSIWLVGFHITLPIFLFLFIGLTLRQWVLASIMGVAIWVFTYVILSQLMHIVFPTTLLRRWMIMHGYF